MSITELLLMCFSAIFIENFIFVKFMGICPFLGVSGRINTAMCMGAAVTFVMTVASAASWLVYRFVLVPFELEYLETIAFIIIIASLVQLIELFMKKSFPPLYKALGIYLPLITTNCAVLGVALLNIQNDYGFIESVLYGMFAALGFTFALFVFAGVRQRLALADAPRAFDGVPLSLLAAGLVAMAFSGFMGISLTELVSLPFTAVMNLT